MEDFMDDEHPVHGVDPMLSHHLSLNHHHHHHHNNNNNHHDHHNQHQQNSHHNGGGVNGGTGTHPHNSLDSLHDHNDPLLSSHQHNVDISHCIDPLLANHLLGSPSSHRGGHEDNDSLVSEMSMDMVA